MAEAFFCLGGGVSGGVCRLLNYSCFVGGDGGSLGLEITFISLL